MELIKVVNNEIEIAENVKNKVKELHELAIMYRDIETQLKEALLKAMREHDIKSIDNEVFKAVYKEPSVRNDIDRKALKEQGLYDKFLKETPVKDSVTITFK